MRRSRQASFLSLQHCPLPHLRWRRAVRVAGSRLPDSGASLGWRASVAWLTLAWIGFEDVRVYDGSWIEWGAGGAFPIETDP